MTTQERITKVLRARQAGSVKRCHTTPHMGEYKVSEHTCQMLLLLDILAPKAPQRLWRAVLYHDLHEFYTGDIPGSVGKIDPELRQAFQSAGEIFSEYFGWAVEDLSEEEQRWLKAIDKLELLLWCHDELNMGNDNVNPMLTHTQEWFTDNKETVPYTVRSFVNNYQWRRMDGGEL